MTPGVTPFGVTRSGDPVHRVCISNGTLSAAILTYGIALQDVRLANVSHSLTVGSPDLTAYEGEMYHCGTLMGPVANRIGGAVADIDGTTFRFDTNLNGQHTLHGGSAATHARVWQIADHGQTHAECHLSLPDSEGGFPGNRKLTARYSLCGTALTLTLTASTDAPTLMNLANHSYWRLDDTPTYAGQTLRIAADRYLPSTQEDVLPTGDIAPVADTRFDFRQPRVLQPGTEGLIDTNFCLSNTRQPIRSVAWLRGTSGLSLTLATTEPGLQVFDGHILRQPGYASNDGPPYTAHAGLALEAQFWPDAPNNPAFPSIVLRPGAFWQQVTSWTFTL